MVILLLLLVTSFFLLLLPLFHSCCWMRSHAILQIITCTQNSCLTNSVSFSSPLVWVISMQSSAWHCRAEGSAEVLIHAYGNELKVSHESESGEGRKRESGWRSFNQDSSQVFDFLLLLKHFFFPSYGEVNFLLLHLNSYPKRSFYLTWLHARRGEVIRMMSFARWSKRCCLFLLSLLWIRVLIDSESLSGVTSSPTAAKIFLFPS